MKRATLVILGIVCWVLLPAQIELTNGKIGIGTATPAVALDLKGSQLRYSDLDDKIRLAINGSGNLILQQTDGHVGIGTTTPSRKLHVYSTGEGSANNYNSRHHLKVSGGELTTHNRTNLAFEAVNETIDVLRNSRRLYVRAADLHSTVKGNTTAYDVRGSYSVGTHQSTGVTNALFGSYSLAQTHNSAATGGSLTNMYASYNLTSIHPKNSTNVGNAYGSIGKVSNNNNDAKGTIRGIQGEYSGAAAAGNVSHAEGVFGYVYSAATNSTITNSNALKSYTYINNPGTTVSNAYGVYNRIYNRLGTVNNAYLYYGRMDGTYGKEYGLYIDDVSSTVNMKHFLDGKVGIGVVDPTEELHIGQNGDFRIDGIGTYAKFNMFDGGAGNDGILDIDVHDETGVDDALVRFFRNTNTTGPVGIIINTGDGSVTANSQLSANGNSYINASVGNVGVGTNAPRSKLNINGGMAIGQGNGVSSTHGSKNSLQILTDTYYGGNYDNHSGFLIWSQLNNGWGDASLHFAGATNWGEYNTVNQTMVLKGTNVGIGVVDPNYTLHTVNTTDADGFYFKQTDKLTGEKDVFTIEDADNGGGGQDKSSVLKLLKSGHINSGDYGFSLSEITYTGNNPGNNKYYISGNREDEGAPQWGVQISDSEIWSTGGLRIGATTNANGTYSGGTFIANADGTVKLPSYTTQAESDNVQSYLGIDNTGKVVKAKVSAGSLIQQKFTKTTPARQTIRSATPVKINGLEITITPTDPNSIIEIEAHIATSATYVSSFGIFRNGQPALSTSGYTNNNEPNMQVTEYHSSSSEGEMHNVPVYYFEKANTTSPITYDIRATSAWSGGLRNLFINNRSSNDMASVSYMTVREIVGEEVINTYSIDPKEQQVKTSASNINNVSDDPNQISTIEAELEEQRNLIKILQEQLDELTNQNSAQAESIHITLLNNDDTTPFMSQNIPNPTSNTAKINYFIPTSAVNSEIRFYSLGGQIMKSVSLEPIGAGVIDISLSDLKSGSYMYSLIVDDQLIDTKTMVVVK